MLVTQATLTHIASLALFPSTEIVFTLKSTPREEKKKSLWVLQIYSIFLEEEKKKAQKKSCGLTGVIREQGIEVTSET